MRNCWICGCSEEIYDMKTVWMNGKKRAICEDGDCDEVARSEAYDRYHEPQEDTPCLDAPWWHYR